jgi:hypothetical protein
MTNLDFERKTRYGAVTSGLSEAKRKEFEARQISRKFGDRM